MARSSLLLLLFKKFILYRVRNVSFTPVYMETLFKYYLYIYYKNYCHILISDHQLVSFVLCVRRTWRFARTFLIETCDWGGSPQHLTKNILWLCRSLVVVIIVFSFSFPFPLVFILFDLFWLLGFCFDSSHVTFACPMLSCSQFLTRAILLSPLPFSPIILGAFCVFFLCFLDYFEISLLFIIFGILALETSIK